MGDAKYLKLNDIEAYKIAYHLSNYVWDIVVQWDFFAKRRSALNSLMRLIPSLPILLRVSGGGGKKTKSSFTGTAKVQERSVMIGTKNLAIENSLQKSNTFIFFKNWKN